MTKVYPTGKGKASLRAVDHISFTVPQGQVFGFLGPNGAGKTTTIRMLTGLARPTEGNASILGYDLATEITRIKKAIGVVPETSNLYDELSARDNLIFMGQLYGVPRPERGQRADTLLRRFRLWEKRDTPFAQLSKGMKRALTVAAALVHQPQLLFLDEPTTGLDVMSARNLRQMIMDLRDTGVTVFLTTHYLEEAERLCDRIAILVKGHIVALDTVDGLKAAAQGTTAIEVTLADAHNRITTQRIEGDDVAAALRAALAQANERQLLAINTVRPTLEEVFVQLTGLSAEVMLAEKGNQQAVIRESGR
ncbi:MAG: ABC transporter ATP-binding protein [Chloroflexi bacterium]|nr:ABC transporter ATP-binding protein [Chloroflexota bacterium]